MRVKKPKTNDDNEDMRINNSNYFNYTLNKWETGFHETPFKTRASYYTRKTNPILIIYSIRTNKQTSLIQLMLLNAIIVKKYK